MRARNYTPNDNQDVIRSLAANFAQTARGRNRILTLTVALSIITLGIVFGMSWGKICSESLHSIRGAGTAASGVIENGNAAQYAALKTLGYIKQTGRYMTVGTAEAAGEIPSSKRGTAPICTVRWADFDAWENLFHPAYTEIYGSYPKKEQDIMLSRRALESLGISAPQKGMEISLSIAIGLFRTSEETFTLCGWFTDYSHETAPGYISQKKLNDWGLPFNENSNLIFRQQNGLGWEATEKRLYEDLKLKSRNQKVTVTDTAIHQAVTSIMGGYTMAVLGTVVVLCGVFFLCHNVMQISMAGDLRKLGLLNTIGATKKQLAQIYHRQIRRTLIWGTAAGTMLSAIVLAGILPRFLGNQYLRDMGGAEGLPVFQPMILLLSTLFTDGILLTASDGVIRKTVKMSCIESAGYTKVSSRTQSDHRYHEKTFPSKKRSPIREMQYLAWRNIAGHRGQFILTVLSLFLGLEAFLGAFVITKGSDYIHVIEQRPDFLIAGQFSMFGREQGYGEEYKTRDAGQDPMLTDGDSFKLLYDNEYDEFSPISGKVRDELLGMEGVDQGKSYIMEGAYLYAVLSAKGIRPMVSGSSAKGPEDAEMIEGAAPATIQILKKDEIEDLENYVEANALSIDMKALKNGTGVLFLHDHALSAAQEKLAEESIGEPLYFNTMGSRESRDTSKQSENFTLCGYLDNRGEGFPKIRQTWHGAEGSWYFLISEEGFDRIPTERKTLYMELKVASDKEPVIKSEIQKIISKENLRRSRTAETAANDKIGEAGIFCISKSDLTQEAASYIQGNRLILGSISAILLAAGFTNYFNVMVTGIFAREKEWKIMEIIGMTEKQKRIMLLAEGGCYCLFTAGLLLTMGMGILLLIRSYMEQKLSYFSFTWPTTWMALLIGGLAIINMATVWAMYKARKKHFISASFPT